jgi:predicted nucleotidyltransferase component of viral defense system
MNNPHTKIELFHLLFLKQLEGKIDKKLYSLKGGCNLRFFFKSIRYSEDIDFDIAIMSVVTLTKKINTILSNPGFIRILQSKGIQIIKSNAVKQTNTTQRWKLMLSFSDINISLPTKIEFSRRKLNEGFTYEAIDKDVITFHKLYPVLCNHYEKEAAFLQKIDELINRTQIQARDVFDLKVLLDLGVIPKKISSLTKALSLLAIETIKQIHYVDFKGQVVAYLMDEYQDFYGSEKSWEDIQSEVISSLGGI